MSKIFKKGYPAQAIAIIMVILVVATVLGASLYSRTLKNKEAAINTKDSMMAVEQADSLLDLFVRADYNFLLSLFDDVRVNGPKDYTSIGEIKALLEENNVDSTILDSQAGITNWCEYNAETNPSSSIKLTIAPADSATDYIDVRVGSARVFDLKGNTYSDGACYLILKFEAREDSPTLFTIKEIYGNDSDEVLPYVNDGSTDDMLAFCFTRSGDPCPTNLSSAAPSSSFIALESGNTRAINLKKSRDGMPLRMIRVIPLNNVLAVSHSFSVANCSKKTFSYMKINAGVNCYGSFREKQIMVPGLDSLGYSSLFDYTIYNTGILAPRN
ncbi:MAG: hypothetical protein ACOX0X_02750 [Candidatus Dojkabacteria bacterium]|jgi:hypothetical protein